MISVKVDSSQFTKAMRGFERQIPYAIARSLTATAKDAQAAIRADLSTDFMIRTGWVSKGIRIQPATKTTLQAAVGSVDPFMEAQAIGGGKSGSAVPQVGRGLPRPAEKSVTRKARWPGSYLSKGKTFIGSPFGGDDAVWQRVMKGKGKGKSRYSGLRLLYLLPDKTKIPARWPLKKIVEDVVRRSWADHAHKAMEQAMKTAK